MFFFKCQSQCAWAKNSLGWVLTLRASCFRTSAWTFSSVATAYLILHGTLWMYKPMGCSCTGRTRNVYFLLHVCVSLWAREGSFVVKQDRKGQNGLEVVEWTSQCDTIGVPFVILRPSQYHLLLSNGARWLMEWMLLLYLEKTRSRMDGNWPVL